MTQQQMKAPIERPSAQDLQTIITDPNGARTLVLWADRLGKALKDAGLSTSQIRALFGEVRQIQAERTIKPERAFRRLVLLRPKMAYRARKERGKAVRELVDVLDPALELVINANNWQDNFQRFVEFFEAILAYHKAYGGD